MRSEFRFLGLLSLGFFVLGCLGPGTERQPRMYVLDAVVPVTELERIDLSIGVGPISLPERLDRPQIVTRSGEFEVEIADFDRWAEPLQAGFASVLAEDLARAIPTDRVAVYPWPRSTPVTLRIPVVVTRFEGELGGSVTLAVRWRLLRADGREIGAPRNSSYREPAGDSTEQLVAAMSRAIAALAEDVAGVLRSAAQSDSR